MSDTQMIVEDCMGLRVFNNLKFVFLMFILINMLDPVFPQTANILWYPVRLVVQNSKYQNIWYSQQCMVKKTSCSNKYVCITDKIIKSFANRTKYFTEKGKVIYLSMWRVPTAMSDTFSWRKTLFSIWLLTGFNLSNELLTNQTVDK